MALPFKQTLDAIQLLQDLIRAGGRGHLNGLSKIKARVAKATLSACFAERTFAGAFAASTISKKGDIGPFEMKIIPMD